MIIKDFRYIYNIYQANFYVANNLKIYDTGVAENGKVFYKFKDSRELQEIFKKWCDLQKNKKLNK